MASKEYMRLWRKNNPEKVKEIEQRRYKKDHQKRLDLAKKYYEDNKEEILKKPRKRGENYSKWKKEYYLKNKDEIKTKNKQLRELNKRKYKSNNLLKKYGISIEDYDKMYLNQNGKCSICDTFYEKLCIDHCHLTTKVRELLCEKCNKAIGLFNESIDNFSRAIEYVRKYR